MTGGGKKIPVCQDGQKIFCLSGQNTGKYFSIPASSFCAYATHLPAGYFKKKGHELFEIISFPILKLAEKMTHGFQIFNFFWL